MTDYEWTDGPLRVERDVWPTEHSEYRHALTHRGERTLRYLTDAEADVIEAQLAATAPDLPPHVAAVLADGLPPGVRVMLGAFGGEIPLGWDRSVADGHWRHADGAVLGALYEVRPPVPPAPPHERVQAEAIEVCRKALMDRFSDDFEMEDIASAANAAAAVLGRAALPDGEQS